MSYIQDLHPRAALLSSSEKLLQRPMHALGFAQLLNLPVALLLINASLKLCLGATKVYWVENYFKH